MTHRPGPDHATGQKASDSRVNGTMRRTERPAWHKRPTGPGMWVCWAEDQTARIFPIGPILKLTQEDLDRGSPFSTACVYGPILEPPTEFTGETTKPDEFAQV